MRRPEGWRVPWAEGALLALAPLCMFPYGVGVPTEVRTFEITAARYHFDPPSIAVQEGDHVRLLLHSIDTTHGLAIEALGVKVVIPKGGEVVSVEFVAGPPGRYVMKCSEYCGSGHRRMRGELLVTEASS